MSLRDKSCSFFPLWLALLGCGLQNDPKFELKYKIVVKIAKLKQEIVRFEVNQATHRSSIWTLFGPEWGRTLFRIIENTSANTTFFRKKMAAGGGGGLYFLMNLRTLL